MGLTCIRVENWFSLLVAKKYLFFSVGKHDPKTLRC